MFRLYENMMIIIYEAMTRDDDDRTREDRATRPKKAEFRNNFQLTWSSPPEMFRFLAVQNSSIGDLVTH